LDPIESAEIELSELLKLFYSDSHLERDLGLFRECDRESMPAVYRQLLAHHHHMTVTVEKFHQSPIELQVLATKTAGDLYARKILLRRISDGRVVLFGIVRIDLDVLDQRVRKEIEGQLTPLGEVLIKHDVLRQVKLVGLYEIEPGHELAQWFGRLDHRAQDDATASSTNLTAYNREVAKPGRLYGRTAIIFCDGRPVIELLEIVAD
jgi:chorismate-pyruvate lyase